MITRYCSPIRAGDLRVPARALIRDVFTKTLICVPSAGPSRMDYLLVPSYPNLAKRRLKPTVNQRVRTGPFRTPEPLLAPNLPFKYGRVPRTIDTPHFGDIVTPLLWRRFLYWLEGHDPHITSYLVNGIRFGFDIRFSGSPFSALSRNHPSARLCPDSLSPLIHAEVQSQRVAGPFDSPPFDTFVVSPLGLVPKKEPGSFRVIHDLSFPKGRSVNDGILQDDAAVRYETFDHVVSIIQRIGTGALIAKVDIEHAFRIIPVRPEDRHLLGFMFDHKYYFDKCLPMGCRSSCAIFESLSCAIQWIATHKLSIPFISHILDDFIILGPPASSIADLALEAFLLFCRDCGIPIKSSKTVLPSTCVVVHGIEVDTVNMQARLPEDKLTKARSLLVAFSRRRRVRSRDLQSLLGFLNFACKVILPGRAFLRRLFALLPPYTSYSRRFITLSKEARQDIRAWLHFLARYNGVTIFPSPTFQDSHTLKLYSDAAGSLGFAAIFGSKWFCDRWPHALHSTHITVKELFPIVLLVELWGPYFENRRILFFCDNAAVVDVINKQSSRDPTVMILVRRFVLSSLRHNFLFRARHIPGAQNVLADKLSRFQFQAARQMAPWLDPAPTPIPPALLSIACEEQLST